MALQEHSKMTLHEAKEILKEYINWQRYSYSISAPNSCSKFCEAIDRVLQGTEIAQNIRNAAINWPHFLADVECGIIKAYCEYWTQDFYNYYYGLHNTETKEEQFNQSLVFMLLVAEELES
jgi:hypothetical protein